MKKAFVLFVSVFLLGLAGICILPGFILQEADNVTLTEQVLFGDKALVEGVTVNIINESMQHLLWDTTFVVGKEPVTEFEFYAKQRNNEAMLRDQTWMAQSEYSCIVLGNPMHGGFSASSSGSLNLEGGIIENNGLEEAFKELAAETAPGEEKTKQIVLSQYLEYFPVAVTVHEVWEDEELSEAYSEFFKIPVPKDATYTISLTKNKQGKIAMVGGRPDGQSFFNWRSVSARSEEACYFTFYRYASDGTKMDTGLIPGGFGIYRQPYTLEPGEVNMDPAELSMVYSLEEESYPISRIFLDVNEAGQLLIVTDTENFTKLQVVDLTTFEKVQQLEVTRPAGKDRFDSVVRVKDNFLLLSYTENCYALLDWNEERGYQHQFTMQVAGDDPLYWNAYIGKNDMDWNGKHLLYVTCTDRKSIRDSCDFTLSVYDATGKVYQGAYKSSLMTEQERELLYGGASVGPGMENPITVSWPE